MSWADSIGNLSVLDKWRADAGLKFGIERAEARPRTLRNAPLAKPNATIPHKPVRGLAKSASRLALGFEDFPDFASAAILLDAFWEQGGNVLDTVFVRPRPLVQARRIAQAREDSARLGRLGILTDEQRVARHRRGSRARKRICAITRSNRCASMSPRGWQECTPCY